MWDDWNSKKNMFKKYEEVKSHLIYGRFSEECPLVSITIPTYRRASLLKEAINSALNQKDFNNEFDIIVVDNDCSIDIETDLLMREVTLNHNNILYFRNEMNIGAFGNWNRCIELCRSKWLCLLHDDDLLSEYYLNKVNPLLCNEQFGLIGVYTNIIDDRIDKHSRLSTGNSVFEDIFIMLRRGIPIPITIQDNMRRIHVLSIGTLLNKNKSIEVGGFDDQYYQMADSLFYSKMSFYYETLFLPIKLTYYRISNNVSLAEETCINNVEGVFFMTNAIVSSVSHTKHCQNLPKINAIIQEDSNNKFNPFVDYSSLWKKLGINSKYNNKLIKKMIIVYYKILWAMLLFRNYKDT